MKTELILVCLFSLFGRAGEAKAAKEAKACRYLCSVVWRWKD